MCGIAGVFVRDERTPDQSLGRRMIDSVAHRGPDDRAVHVEPHIALAAARLSIVDLSRAADQPLHDASGELTIVFNGEIYNFKEVRADLESRGHRFRSHSDTEVVLNAYREWGTDCQRRFNGMWAFAIWDRRNLSLYLSRDRFGVKPLFIAQLDGSFFFASEIKALLAAGVPAKLASAAFNSYCGGESMFEGIEPLAAGCCMELRVSQSNATRRRWWDTAANLVNPPKRYQERVEAFRELLKDSVRLRLRADVRPAVTLSGGLDSSAIYAACQELSQNGLALSATEERPIDVAACMVSFAGSAIDESAFATRVADHFGRDVRRFAVNPDDFRAMVERATWHQEALVWNVSVLVYHDFYRQLAEAGTRVVLEGNGADELLAGYGQFAQDAMEKRLRSFRIFSAWSAARALSRARNPLLGHTARSPLQKLGGAILRSLVPRRMKGKKAQTGSLIDRDLLTRFAEPPPFAASIPELSPLKRALYGGFHDRLLPTVLRVNDRATMASGVESRAPFLDHRLVSFVFSLPDPDILGGGWTKKILRDAMAPYLPPEIVWRENKFGFLAPQPEWFRRPAVLSALQEAAIDGTVARTPGIDQRLFAQKVARGKLTGFSWQESTELWTAYSYAVWHDVFIAAKTNASEAWTKTATT